MKIFICLISSNENINAEYGKSNRSLIPKEIFKHHALNGTTPNIAMGSFDPREGSSLEDYLSRAVGTSDAAILLIEQGHEDAADAMRSAFFSVVIPIDEKIRNVKNFFAGILNTLLKNFFNLWALMADLANEQAMILPLRNFDAVELRDLADVCRDQTMLPTFRNSVKDLTTLLRERRRPRRKSNAQKKHFVDDDEKLFEYGKEVHSNFETGPPHTASCAIAGNFRFGKKISAERHFNVTREVGALTKISGDFPNCHGALLKVEEKSHINMFSNDYH